MITTERGREIEKLISGNLDNLLFESCSEATDKLNQLLSKHIDFDVKFAGFKPYHYNNKCYSGDIYYLSGIDNEYRCSTVTICNGNLDFS